MCLDVDVEHDVLSSGERRARREHKCHECRRLIEPGERYQYWSVKPWDNDTVETQKMCAHCRSTIDLGAALTGCPRSWYWDQIHELDPDDGGFVGDILVNHELRGADRAKMLRQVVRRKRQWRRPNGELYPLQQIPVAA